MHNIESIVPESLLHPFGYYNIGPSAGEDDLGAAVIDAVGGGVSAVPRPDQ
jgi:hypothetical protein